MMTGGAYFVGPFNVCLYCYVLYVPCVITCWERADLLALLCVMLTFVLSLFNMVHQVKCSTWCIDS